MTRMAGAKQHDEAPLTEIEKSRARNMMRNNCIFQSLGIGAIVSMIRKSNDGQEGSAIANDDSTSAVTQGGSSDYNPNNDEAIDEEEVDDNVVNKKVKVSRRKKSAVKKTSKPKSSEASSTMALGRVMVVPPESLKRMLDETVPTRVTRSKGIDVTNHEDSRLPMGIVTTVRPRNRKGAGLERMTKSLGTKVVIYIAEGMKRPEKPLQAAKLATEGGLIARSHTPVLPHFKEYKNDTALIDNYIGKVVVNFEIDTGSKNVRATCTDMLQKRSKNRRHLIKKQYFDNVAANELSIKSPVGGMSDDEWQRLVALWSTPRHKKTCDANKQNRGKVKYQQKTGSRSYIAHICAIKEARKGEELSAIDLFKATHHSSKDGFSEPVQKAIAEMEKKMVEPVQEGEEQKSATAVVAEVLTKEFPSSMFLMNVGLQSSSARNKFIRSEVVAAQVTDLQEKLERSEQQGVAMQEELAALRKKSKEAEVVEAARDKEYELRFARLIAMFGGPSGN